MLSKIKLGRIAAFVIVAMLIFQGLTISYTQSASALTWVQDLTFRDKVESLEPGEVAVHKTVFWTSEFLGEADAVFEVQGKLKDDDNKIIATEAMIEDSLSMYFEFNVVKYEEIPEYYEGVSFSIGENGEDIANVEIGDISDEKVFFVVPLKLKEKYLPTNLNKEGTYPISSSVSLKYIDQDGKSIILSEEDFGYTKLKTSMDIEPPEVPEGGLPPSLGGDDGNSEGDDGGILPPTLGGDDGGILPPTDGGDTGLESVGANENNGNDNLGTHSSTTAISDLIAVAPVIGEVTPFEEVQIPVSNFIATITEDVGPSWSILNVMVTALIETLTIVLLLPFFKRKKVEIEREREGEEREKALEESIRAGIKIVTLIPAIGAMVLILLSQDMSGQMVFFNEWTVVFLALLIVEVAAVLLSREPSYVGSDDSGLS